MKDHLLSVEEEELSQEGRGRGRANVVNHPIALVEQPQVQLQAQVQLDLANLAVALQQRL